MAYTLRMMNFLDTALRVPPLFIMDEVLKLSCGFTNLKYASYVQGKNPLMNEEILTLEPLKGQNINQDQHFLYADNFSMNIMAPEHDMEINELSFIPTVGKVLFCFIALFAAQMIFLLSWTKLVQVYTFLFSLILIVFSYQANMTSIKVLSTIESNSSNPALLQSLLSLNSSALWNSGGIAFCIISNYIFQAGLGLLFTALIPIFHQSVVRAFIIFSFLVPTFTLLLPLSLEFKSSVPVFSALLPLGILKYVFMSNLYNFIIVIIHGYQYARMVLNNYGLHSLLESEWIRLNVPNVLRTFWMIRTAQHISVLLSEYMFVQGEYQSLFSMKVEDGFVIFKEVMIYGCETSIALLGMTSIVSYIGHYIGILFQTILMSEDDEERSMGTVCAILFFILAEQCGLTVLKGEKRFVRLCRNFSFLFTAMLHFTHNMVNPVLMSLSASRNPVTHRHARALFVSFILILFPCLLIYILWNQYPLSTWLLAVSAFSVQVIVKILVSLLIYSFFLIDAYRNNFWESLDDYVYYIRAFGNSVEFIFGILLFFTGAWIYFFESGGSIRATMMCIHAYFNIWCEAKNGWSVFMKRRTAVNKINSLPEATLEELEKHSDVCAICFQDLQNAKKTKCNHLFHSVCLRKWLYVQDSCPLCHETLYKTDQPAEEISESSGEESQNQENMNVDNIISEEPEVQELDDVEMVEQDILWEYEDIEVILGEAMPNELQSGGFETRSVDIEEVVEEPFVENGSRSHSINIVEKQDESNVRLRTTTKDLL